MKCCLAQGELIRVDGEKNGVILRCTRGTVWLTCGDGRDYLLSAGRSVTIAAHQFAVAEALHASECNLDRVQVCSYSRPETTNAGIEGALLYGRKLLFARKTANSGSV
jgi:hypothetical protein